MEVIVSLIEAHLLAAATIANEGYKPHDCFLLNVTRKKRAKVVVKQHSFVPIVVFVGGHNVDGFLKFEHWQKTVFLSGAFVTLSGPVSRLLR